MLEAEGVRGLRLSDRSKRYVFFAEETSALFERRLARLPSNRLHANHGVACVRLSSRVG